MRRLTFDAGSSKKAKRKRKSDIDSMNDAAKRRKLTNYCNARRKFVKNVVKLLDDFRVDAQTLTLSQKIDFIR